MPQAGELYSKLGEPQLKGQATEAVLKSAFVKRGLTVLEPTYDNEPYDFVVELDGSFIRLQAKTARETESGTLQFETVSTKARSDGYVRDGYIGEIDYFAVFSPSRESKYLVPIEESAKGKMELRTEEPKNNQWKGVNWHEDYLLDAVLDTGL
jgi:hypothetical protein